MLAAIAGIVGVIIGVFLAQFLEGWAQRRRWIADNKKAEYAELLTAINHGFATMMALKSRPPFIHNEEYERSLITIETTVSATIVARIFTAKEIVNLKIMERWTHATRQYSKNNDHSLFGIEVNRMTEDIRKAALENINSV